MRKLASDLQRSIKVGTSTTEWQYWVNKVTCVKTATLEASCTYEVSPEAVGHLNSALEATAHNTSVKISADGESYEKSEPR